MTPPSSARHVVNFQYHHAVRVSANASLTAGAQHRWWSRDPLRFLANSSSTCPLESGAIRRQSVASSAGHGRRNYVKGWLITRRSGAHAWSPEGPNCRGDHAKRNRPAAEFRESIDLVSSSCWPGRPSARPSRKDTRPRWI